MILSGNQWFVLVVLVALAVGAVTAINMSKKRGSRSRVTAGPRRVIGDVADVTRDLHLALVNGTRRTNVYKDGNETIVAVRTFTPGWAIVVAILLFPVGLVALIARTTESGTVLLRQEQGGVVSLSFGGRFHHDAVRAVNEVIEARSRRLPRPT